MKRFKTITVGREKSNRELGIKVVKPPQAKSAQQIENDALRQQFAVWLGLPEYGRAEDEQTLEQWAKKHGVDRTTCIRWRLDPQVIEMANNALKTLGGNEKLRVIRKIIEQAIAGNWQQQRLYMEWMGEVGNKSRSNDVPREIRISMTTEEERTEDGYTDTEENA